MIPSSIKNSTTHHTNKLAPHHKPIISQHIVTSPTSHLPPQNSQHCPRTLKPTTQSTNSLLPTYHHTSTHITKKSHHPTTKLTAAISQTNHLPTHRDITHLTPTTPKSQHPPKNLPSLHNTTQSLVAFSPTPHHPHITSQNPSPPNLQNILLNHPPHIYHPKTHNTHQNIFLSLSQHNSINCQPIQLHPQNHLIKQTLKNT